MKPIDLFKHFSVFKSAIDGTDVPQELKLEVAKEFKRSLPPVAFSTACPATRQWLGDAVQSVIDALQAKEDERRNPDEAPKAKKAKAKA